MSATDSAAFPRIYHLPHRYVGAAANFPAELERCRDMGFSHVLTTPPFKPAANGDIFLTADPDRLDDRLASTRDAADFLHWLADECRLRDLTLLLDLRLDQMAAAHPLVAADPGCFSIRRESVAYAIDPRQEAEPSGIALARFGETSCAERLIDWWATRIAGYLELGIGGARILRPDILSAPQWRRLMEAARGPSQRGSFIASTWGISREALRKLEGSGFDHVQSSLPWWDLKSSWLIEEFDALRLVAPPIAAPVDPLGARLASGNWRAKAAHERMLTLSCATGCGFMVPMGYEYGIAAPYDSVRSNRDDYLRAVADKPFDMTAELRAANDFVQRESVLKRCGVLRGLSGPSARVTALLRSDSSNADEPVDSLLILANPDDEQPSRIEGWPVVSGIGGVAKTLSPLKAQAPVQQIDDLSLLLAPGEVRLLRISGEKPIRARSARRRMQIAAAKESRLVIDGLTPGDADAGAVKRVIGDAVRVECDVLCDGDPWLAVELQWRANDETRWRRRRMNFIGDQRWSGTFFLSRMGAYEFAVEAWVDRYGAFQKRLLDKLEARRDITAELEHGRIAIEAAWAAMEPEEAAPLRDLLAAFDAAPEEERAALLLSPKTAVSLAEAGERPLAVRSRVIAVDAERAVAAYGNWFAAGMMDHGAAAAMLPQLRSAGFDVLSIAPPALAKPPAGGSERASWSGLLAAARRSGMEIAVDLRLADASLAEDSEGGFDFKRWTDVHDDLSAWSRGGISLFRIRDAAQMPFAFWRWAIADLKRENPSAVFVADGALNLKTARRLTAEGFSQAVLALPRPFEKHDMTRILRAWEVAGIQGSLRPHLALAAPAPTAAPLELARCVLSATLAGSWSAWGGSDGALHDLTRRLNWIRRAHPALQGQGETAFYNVHDRRALYYGRSTREREDILLVMVNLAPEEAYETGFELPLWEWGLPDNAPVQVEDLIAERRFVWQGKIQRTKFEPQRYPFAIWRIQPQR
ncbi:MAG TPA: maltotransferase domain-containing protein [Alphaproteobacteria bacterium]|nr:maltotransferase domain-containing protein [Alphaproteobacteria bacterium]